MIAIDWPQLAKQLMSNKEERNGSVSVFKEPSSVLVSENGKKKYKDCPFVKLGERERERETLRDFTTKGRKIL